MFILFQNRDGPPDVIQDITSEPWFPVGYDASSPEALVNAMLSVMNTDDPETYGAICDYLIKLHKYVTKE